MAKFIKHCQNSEQHSKICEKFISLLYLRHLPSLGSRCSFASSAAWARGARVCVFRQNSWGQSGCLGSAFLRLKRLEATLTLTQASLTRRHRGRTCLLIREHALMANTQGSSWQKTLLALIGGIASVGTEKSILWIKRGLYVGTIYPSFFVQHVNEF